MIGDRVHDNGAHVRTQTVMKTYILPYKDLNPQPLGQRVTPLTIRITHVIYNYNNYITSYHKMFSMIFLNIINI